MADKAFEEATVIMSFRHEMKAPAVRPHGFVTGLLQLTISTAIGMNTVGQTSSAFKKFKHREPVSPQAGRRVGRTDCDVGYLDKASRSLAPERSPERGLPILDIALHTAYVDEIKTIVPTPVGIVGIYLEETQEIILSS